MTTPPASYLEHSDTLPGMDEEFTSPVPKFTDVKVHTLPEEVSITLDDGSTVEGYLMYTEGLSPETFEFELVGLSPQPPHPDSDDPAGLRSSASMAALNIPHLIPVGLTAKVMAQLHRHGLPTNACVQVLFDETALDTDQPTTMEDANWVADGGIALFDEQQKASVINQFFLAIEGQEQERREEIQESQRRMIDQHGWTCVGVLDPDNVEPVFVYTIGLTRKGLPELFISGLFDPQDLTVILNQVGDYYTEAGEFYPKTFERHVTIDLDGKETDIAVRIVEVDATTMLEKYLIQAQPVLGQEVPRVAWVQFSDSQGRFPHDENFINTFQQPMLD